VVQKVRYLRFDPKRLELLERFERRELRNSNEAVGTPGKQGRITMMDSVNTPRPTTRTLAVIDGGLNIKDRANPLSSSGKPKLLEQVRQAIRTRHYSDKTEEAYVGWIKRFIFFHNKRHPTEMVEAEIALFLSRLATESHVSSSTQNQALNALLFLYKEVLDKKIGFIQGIVRAKRSRRLPIVLTKEEVKRVLSGITGTPWLMAMLLYGAGLRLMECCRLRAKDIDFSKNQIVIRAGKGDKDRYTMLPGTVKEPLLRHLQAVKRQHEEDLRRGLGRVALPNALERKYVNAGKEWGWQWIFPATGHYIDRVTGEKRRHHLHESVLQRAFREARLKVGIADPLVGGRL